MGFAQMNSEQINNSGTREIELNVDVPESQVNTYTVEPSQARVAVGESHEEGAERDRDKKLDLWMKNIKEFIRNIDVQSL